MHHGFWGLNMLQDTRGDKIFNSFTLTWAAAGYYYQGLAPIRSMNLAGWCSGGGGSVQCNHTAEVWCNALMIIWHSDWRPLAPLCLGAGNIHRDKSAEIRRRSVLLLLIMLTRGARGSTSQICIWWVFLEIYSSQNIQYLFYSIFCVCKLQRCSGDLGLGTPCYKIHVFMNTHFLTVIVFIITTCVPQLFLCPDTTSLLDTS